MAFSNLVSPNKNFGPKYFFSKYIYKTPRKNLQNPWTPHPNFWNRNCRNTHKPEHLLPEYLAWPLNITGYLPPEYSMI